MKIAKQFFTVTRFIAMKAMPLLAGLILSLGCSSIASAEIYQSKDKTGAAVFSDIQTNNAKPMVLEPLNTHTPAKTAGFPFAATSTEPTNTPLNNYETLSIQSPSHDQVIRNQSGQLSVAVAITPALLSQHQIQILLDGSAASEPQQSGRFELNEINRGTYQITAQVIDSTTGVVLKSSSAITVHVKQHFKRP